MKNNKLRLVVSTIKNFTLLSLLGTSVALATADLDRQYALQSVGALKSWDNVDDLFAEYVEKAYQSYFTGQSRFKYRPLQKSNEILASAALPYSQVIADREILTQLSRSAKVESLLRTKIAKEGPRYRFTLEWLLTPQIDLLASESFQIEDPKGGKALAMDNLEKLLHEALDRLIAQVPFKGQVTGRDRSAVTVNLGRKEGVKKGDTLVISTLDEVKKHPLLKQVVDWRLSRTGKVVVDEVDQDIAFGSVVEEDSEERPIARFQKVTQIIPYQQEAVPTAGGDGAPVSPLDPAFDDGMARLGWIATGLQVGSMSRDYSVATGTGGRDGGGLYFGGKAEGQLWLTRALFAEAALAHGLSNYSQTNTLSGEDSEGLVDGSGATTLRINGGYSYLVSQSMEGPRGWLRFGYKSQAYRLPTSSTELVGPVTFKSFFLGVGGDLPLRDGYGATLAIDFGLFASASEQGFRSGEVNSASDVSFFLGGYYKIDPKMTFRVGLDITAQGADFSNGASVSNKVIALSPALLFYF